MLFLSTASNLVDGSPGPGFEAAYVKNLATGVTRLVSTSPSGAPVVTIGADLTRSDGSPAVVFGSPSTSDGRDQLFRKNLDTAAVTAIAMFADTGTPLALAGWVISRDGSRLAYSYRDFNGTDAERTVHFREMNSRTTSTLLNGNGETDVHSISADGSRVGLESYASDLAPG